MATSLHTVKTYLNDEELAGLNALAAQLRLSKSDLLRRLLTATPLPEASDFAAHQAVLDIMKVNADLARLGNLLKLALDDPPSATVTRKILDLTAELSDTQTEVKAAARAIHDSLRPRRKARS